MKVVLKPLAEGTANLLGGNMANTIDVATICLGAALGYGLRKEIKESGEVCRNALLAGIAGAAATAAKSEEGKNGN